MLIKVDAAQLEWRTKVFLAQDEIALEEIINGRDLHTENQNQFGLPSRLVAKVFLFRAIFADAFGEKGFAGPAFAYANDADFRRTSSSTKFWEQVIERFYGKYKGVYNHSVGLIREVVANGQIISPSGRIYVYHPVERYGRLDWPRTQILNHVVQGLAADFVMIARRLIWKRIQEQEAYYKGLILPINTVHDDVQFDVDNDIELCYNICILLEKAFADIPEAFKRIFGVEVNVPLAGEAKLGWTLDEDHMMKFNPATYLEDWDKLYEVES